MEQVGAAHGGLDDVAQAADVVRHALIILQARHGDQRARRTSRAGEKLKPSSTQLAPGNGPSGRSRTMASSAASRSRRSLWRVARTSGAALPLRVKSRTASGFSPNRRATAAALAPWSPSIATTSTPCSVSASKLAILPANVSGPVGSGRSSPLRCAAYSKSVARYSARISASSGAEKCALRAPRRHAQRCQRNRQGARGQPLLGLIPTPDHDVARRIGAEDDPLIEPATRVLGQQPRRLGRGRKRAHVPRAAPRAPPREPPPAGPRCANEPSNSRYTSGPCIAPSARSACTVTAGFSESRRAASGSRASAPISLNAPARRDARRPAPDRPAGPPAGRRRLPAPAEARPSLARARREKNPPGRQSRPRCAADPKPAGAGPRSPRGPDAAPRGPDLPAYRAAPARRRRVGPPDRPGRRAQGPPPERGRGTPGPVPLAPTSPAGARPEPVPAAWKAGFEGRRGPAGFPRPAGAARPGRRRPAGPRASPSGDPAPPVSAPARDQSRHHRHRARKPQPGPGAEASLHESVSSSKPAIVLVNPRPSAPRARGSGGARPSRAWEQTFPPLDLLANLARRG